MEDPVEPKETTRINTRKNKLTQPANKPLPEKKMKKTRKSRKPVKNKARNSESSDHDDENRKVDFNALSIHTLRKYRKFYTVPIASNLNKMELAREVNKHFPTIPIEDDKTIISYFLHFTGNGPKIKEEPT